MRLSVNANDPGYPVWRAMRERGLVVTVTVDGDEVRHCFTVDTKRGVVVAADLNDDGLLQLNAKGDAVKRRLLTGKVGIGIGMAAR